MNRCNMWSQVRIETKIIGVGVVTFTVSLLCVVLSLYAIIKEESLHDYLLKHQLNSTDNTHVFNIHLEKNVIDFLTAIFLIFSTLAVGFSFLLIVGIKKNKKDFVIAYFSYGILITIVLLISAILEFLQGFLAGGILSIIFTVIYIWCLIPVHEGYEMMANGVIFGENPYAVMDNAE